MSDFPILSQQILEKIQSSHNILLHLHPSPDPDCVGGALALSAALKQLNKQVTLISGDSPKSEAFSLFPEYNQVKEQTFLQTDLSQYDLFIIIDSSSPNQITKLVSVTFPPSLSTIIIDHHASNEGFASLNLIDSSAPAVCQILYQLFRVWELEVTPDMAVNLYVGLHGDTGGFMYPGTTSETLQIAADLSSINPDFPRYLFHLENHQHPDMITYLGLALSQISHHANNRIVFSTVSHQDLTSHNLHPEHFSSAEVANQLKSVVGWEIAASLIEIEPSVVKVSLRTRQSDKYHMSRIAQALGGGGHPAAAGVTLQAPLNQAVQTLLSTINQLYHQDFPL